MADPRGLAASTNLLFNWCPRIPLIVQLLRDLFRYWQHGIDHWVIMVNLAVLCPKSAGGYASQFFELFHE